MIGRDTAARQGGATYDPITRGVHWLSAILVLIAIVLAWTMLGAPRHGNARDWLIMLHGSVGIVILSVMLFWAGWRLRHRAPPLRPVQSALEAMLARAAQTGIFALLVAMPVSGYVALAAAGKTVALFGLVDIPPLTPESDRLSQTAIALHLAGEFLIYALVSLHIAAALMHGFIRRDGILQRMLPRRG